LKVEQNIARLKHLLQLYGMTGEQLCEIISEGLKTPVEKEAVLKEQIKLSDLKKIDKVFNKGINYYLDPSPPVSTPDASIFFRKQEFHTELNLESRKRVNEFEDLKHSITAMATLSEMDYSRKIEVFNLDQNPREVAFKIRSYLYPKFKKDKRDFLKSLIKKLADYNILVFEFVETWNKKETVNIDGFFLKPNTIVLKRNQSSMSRELFTLAHELGHYLLNEEEVEELDYGVLAQKGLSEIETWCNEFAFCFLAGPYAEHLDEIEAANVDNDYHNDKIRRISKSTHLSSLAIFTRLLFLKKISYPAYKNAKTTIIEAISRKKEKERLQMELLKVQGRKIGGGAPKPLKSPLYVETIQNAFHEGVINEYEVCRKLNIKPGKLEKYI